MGGHIGPPLQQIYDNSSSPVGRGLAPAAGGTSKVHGYRNLKKDLVPKGHKVFLYQTISASISAAARLIAFISICMPIGTQMLPLRS